jgi:hypothetical protein
VDASILGKYIASICPAGFRHEVSKMIKGFHNRENNKQFFTFMKTSNIALPATYTWIEHVSFSLLFLFPANKDKELSQNKLIFS